MGMLQTIMTDGSSSKERRKQWWRKFLANPIEVTKILDVRNVEPTHSHCVNHAKCRFFYLGEAKEKVGLAGI
jgi:hypothetical protein